MRNQNPHRGESVNGCNVSGEQFSKILNTCIFEGLIAFLGISLTYILTNKPVLTAAL